MRQRLEGTGSTSAEDISSDDLKDLFNVLKGQKEGLQALQDAVQNNTRQLFAIDKELENI